MTGAYHFLDSGMLLADMMASCNTSKHAPTSMIFVPCLDGVSHNPREHCSIDDCSNGSNVLLGAMLRYDRLRAERDK